MTQGHYSIQKNDSIFFLSSFPRSGNTWVRFLIANVYNNINKKFDQIDFFNIHNIIPEYGKKEDPIFNNFPNVYKTHKKYMPVFRNTILLTRSPYDTLYSYNDLLNKHKGLQISLEETVLHKEYGIEAIVEHNNSYIKKCKNLLIITYEKLHYNPRKELKKICEFINLIIKDDNINIAVEKSSFHIMNSIEKKKGRKIGDSKFKHIRKGLIGEGTQTLKKNKKLYQYITGKLKESPLLYMLYV